jgi:beta-glucosidase
MGTANELNFPAGFLWGTATSPTQVEGHIQNEWTDFVAQDGGTCRVACDHYHRYPEDVGWMSALGTNAYRMGIEWSRLQPAPFAPLDRRELDRYLDLLDRLRAAGVTPMVVLHHFSNPPWINAAGGWVNPATVPAFVDYVTRLVAALGDRVHLWNTFNEPDTYASLAYILGGFPPCRRAQWHSFRKVIAHMAKAHFRASRVIRRNPHGGVKPQVGIAKNWTLFEPFRRFALWDHAAAALCHYGFNRYVMDAFFGGWRRKASTFVGLNYYGRVRFRNFRPMIPSSGMPAHTLRELGLICDDMVERFVPGFELGLREIHQRCRLPIYITEHGSSSSDEDFRIRDLSEHLQILRQVMAEGLDVRGFFYWSLMDNFEWQFGYTKKFGLLAVDFNDPALPRRMTRIGEYYRGVCGRA